jgi:hypothetical protein
LAPIFRTSGLHQGRRRLSLSEARSRLGRISNTSSDETTSHQTIENTSRQWLSRFTAGKSLPTPRNLPTIQQTSLITTGAVSRSDEHKSKTFLFTYTSIWLTVSRKHRERKENHCRQLEDELHRLYNLITTEEELQNLRFENDVLRDIMLRHSIPLPPDIPSKDTSWAEVKFTNYGGHDQCLQVKLPEQRPAPQLDNSAGPNTESPSIQSNCASTEVSGIRYDPFRSFYFCAKCSSNFIDPETQHITTAA